MQGTQEARGAVTLRPRGTSPSYELYRSGTSMGGASKACLSRLQKEYQRLGKEPVPNVVAEPK